MKNDPAILVYVRDWLGDTQLRMASRATRGIWFDCLCWMQEATDRGRLEFKSIEEMSLFLQAPITEIEQFLEQAERYGFCDVSRSCHALVTLENRRMIREEKKKQSNRLRQSRKRVSRSCHAEVVPTHRNQTNKERDSVGFENESRPAHAGKKSLDINTVLELFNKLCKSLPKARKTDSRLKAFQPSLRKYPEIEYWQSVFKKAEASDFVSGRSGKWAGCSFDWFKSESNRQKVLEGNYDNQRTTQAATPRRTGPDPVVAERRRLAEEIKTDRVQPTT